MPQNVYYTEIYHSKKSVIMRKEEFKRKTRDVLNELAEYIDRLESKAGEIAEDAKEEYQEQLLKLKDIRENLSNKLDEYEKIADTKWDVVKESAGNFFSSVGDAWKENYAKVSEAFKKNADKEKDALDEDEEN